MRHTCEYCAQRYEMPDHKVIGKVLKVRCKTCQGVMHVVGPREGFDPEGEHRPPTLTGVKAYKPGQSGEDVSHKGRVWWAGIGGRAHGPFSTQEVERLIDRGDIHARTRMWQSGMKNWVRISESPTLSFFMEAVVQRTAEDQKLLAGRDPSCVFDRAALLSDGNGYFPNPTLKSGWLVLDENTQKYLETCAQQASWLQNEKLGMTTAETTPRTNRLLRATLTGAVTAGLLCLAVHAYGPRSLEGKGLESPNAPSAIDQGVSDKIIAQLLP